MIPVQISALHASGALNLSFEVNIFERVVFDRKGVVEALLAKIGGGGVFHVNAVSVLGVKGSDDAVVRREHISHTVPGVVKPRIGEPSQDGADDVIR